MFVYKNRITLDFPVDQYFNAFFLKNNDRARRLRIVRTKKAINAAKAKIHRNIGKKQKKIEQETKIPARTLVVHH